MTRLTREDLPTLRRLITVLDNEDGGPNATKLGRMMVRSTYGGMAGGVGKIVEFIEQYGQFPPRQEEEA